MAKTIVLLEDDPRRVAAMTAWLSDRFACYHVETFTSSRALCEWLEQFWEDVVLLSLDHDLALEADGSGRLMDQGTGLEVAEYLAGREPAFPVILHSSNQDAVQRMADLLEQRGWQTSRVTPLDDLEWIASDWWPTLRRVLVNAEGGSAPARGRLPVSGEQAGPATGAGRTPARDGGADCRRVPLAAALVAVRCGPSAEAGGLC